MKRAARVLTSLLLAGSHAHCDQAAIPAVPARITR